MAMLPLQKSTRRQPPSGSTLAGAQMGRKRGQIRQPAAHPAALAAACSLDLKAVPVKVQTPVSVAGHAMAKCTGQLARLPLRKAHRQARDVARSAPELHEAMRDGHPCRSCLSAHARVLILAVGR